MTYFNLMSRRPHNTGKGAATSTAGGERRVEERVRSRRARGVHAGIQRERNDVEHGTDGGHGATDAGDRWGRGAKRRGAA